MARTTRAVKAEDLLPLGAAAELAAPNRGRTSLHVAAQTGAIPVTVIGGVRHFAKGDVEAWSKLSVGEAARHAQCHPQVIEAAAVASELPHATLLGKPRFDRDDVDAWARKRGFLP